MSERRGATVSPLIGWPVNASPVAVQSRREPLSKAKLSSWPSAALGRTPSGTCVSAADAVRERDRIAATATARAHFIIGWSPWAADYNRGPARTASPALETYRARI